MSRASTLSSAFVVAVPLLVVFSGAHVRWNQPFQPPQGILTAGLRETARHRAPLPQLRVGRTVGSPQNVTFWVHVDAKGNVIEVREFKTDGPWPHRYSTNALVEATRKIEYQPFVRKGVPIEAWVQDEVEVGTKPVPPVLSGTGPPFPTLEDPTSFSIQLSRSGCYGTCPSYSVVVHGNGEVEVHGKHYVAIPGDYQTHIVPEAASRLLERFRAADFFELKDNYRAGVTDNPTYCLELVIGSKRKPLSTTSVHGSACPNQSVTLKMLSTKRLAPTAG